MTYRDYKSFARLVGRVFEPISIQLNFQRVTDLVYARPYGEVIHLIQLQVTRFGGDNFYVNYGASVPRMGSPWIEEIHLKDQGILVCNRLQTEDKGQGYDCSSKSALIEAVSQVAADLNHVAVPWFQKNRTLEQVSDTYYQQWDLRPVGSNPHIKRLGVRNFGFLQLLIGNPLIAVEWLREAHDLENGEFDEEDRKLIERAISEILNQVRPN